MYGTTPSPGYIGNSMGQGSVGMTKVAAGASIDVGYMLRFNAGTHSAEPLTSDGAATTFMGTSYDKTPTNSFAQELRDICYYRADGSNEVEVYATPGETYYHNDPVYNAGDPITVRKTGSNSVGTVLLPKGQTSFTASAGDKIRIRTKSAYAGV